MTEPRKLRLMSPEHIAEGIAQDAIKLDGHQCLLMSWPECSACTSPPVWQIDQAVAEMKRGLN
jgi:hypothetical protein